MVKNNKGNNLNDLKKEVDTDAHTIPLEEFYRRYDTNPKYGLTHSEAEERLKRNGLNVLTPPKQRPTWLKFLLSFTDGFSLILILGGVMCFIAYAIAIYTEEEPTMDNLYIGCVLIAVVLLTGTVGFYQNNRSEKIMDSFKKLIPQESLVTRSGETIAIPAKNMVVGDLVSLKSGDFVPADIRVTHANNLKVDNSSLTGESEPQKRYVESTHQNPLETANFLISYTYVVEGSGEGIVIFTGDDTIMGRIANLTSSLAQGKTPIAIEIDHFIKIITAIAVTLGVIFFILSVSLIHLDFVTAVIFLIGIIVANVPEGLLITVTLALSLTARNMASKNCLVKNLNSVETLGSTGVICSDKTGTLTQNQMLVSHLWCNKSIITVLQNETSKREHVLPENSVHDALCRCATVCNNAKFRGQQDESTAVTALKTTGDATESALIKYIEKFIAPVNEYRARFPKLFEIPFNSKDKYQVSVHEVEGESRYLMVMKGAPERITERCSKLMLENEEIDIDDEVKKVIGEANEELANMGERVLGFAHIWLPESEFPHGCAFEENDEPLVPLEGLTFLGLVSLIDPPRSAVPEAVRLCRSAGVRVVMVTGDHPATAKAIARSVGIIKPGSETADEVMKRLKIPFENIHEGLAQAIVVTGGELKDMSSSELDSIIVTYDDIVFARTSPQQKLIIVEGFQRQGYIVAVTGDGVNDSPALRKADIGVAMGIAGSDVAKQAADMILLDDNFATIVTGVQQGRLIFDNLKKSIAYTLTSNIPEIFPFLIRVLANIPLPLGTITILLIDLGTDMVPAISLAYETPEKDIMERKPRNPKKDRLVNEILINYSYLLVGIMQMVNAMMTYLFIMMYNGFDISDLIIGNLWDSARVPFVTDSFGQEWSFIARKDLEFTCHSAYFLATVLIQIADLLISKTRRQSIFEQGIIKNKFMIFGIFFEVALACVVVYVPPLQVALSTRFVNPLYMTIAVVNAVILWGIDEIRRLIMRRSPGGFIERETYY